MNPDLAALVRRHLEAENAQDLPGTLATLHPECRFEDFATGQSWQGHDGAAAHYGQWWTTFDVDGEARSRPARLRGTTDDVYIAEATWHGRHVGPLPRHRAHRPHHRAALRRHPLVQDGLMLGERFHYDLASLLRQIGAEPIPALAGLPHRTAA